MESRRKRLMAILIMYRGYLHVPDQGFAVCKYPYLPTEGINMVASPGCEECAVFTCPRLTGAGFGPTIPHMNGPLEFGLR